jgi:thioredoxin 2
MVLVCPSCQKKNRVAAVHAVDRTRCGACKAELPVPAEPIDADPELFDELTRDARVPVLVDFWAAWCAPCRRAAPEVHRTAEVMAGRALVLKVDTDRHPEVAARFGVQGIPCFLVMKDGRLIRQQAGLVSSAVMTGWLEQAG